MSANSSTVAKPATPASKAKRKPKVLSPERSAAEAAYANAKSDQEKSAARGHLKIVRFREIVVPRVNRALTVLSQVERMANRNAYTWTDEQAQKICKELEAQVASIRRKFEGAKSEKAKFSL